jgi:ferritin-like protein
MIVMRNMDELFDLDLPSSWIAATHVCACNPRKLPHYPADWYDVRPLIIMIT